MTYGYDQSALAVYFNQTPVLAVAGCGGRGGGRGRGGAAVEGVPGNSNMQPNSVPPKLTTLERGRADDGGHSARLADDRRGRGGGAPRAAAAALAAVDSAAGSAAPSPRRRAR